MPPEPSKRAVLSDLTERCDHCEREFDETEDTFVSDSGGDICAHCAAVWLSEERGRLAERVRGAVEENERLRLALRDLKGLMPAILSNARGVVGRVDQELAPDDAGGQSETPPASDEEEATG